jgi:hypothetical protein
MNYFNVTLATQDRYRWTSVTGSLVRLHLLGTLVYRLIFFWLCYVLIIVPFSSLCYLTSAIEETLNNTIGKILVELVWSSLILITSTRALLHTEGGNNGMEECKFTEDEYVSFIHMQMLSIFEITGPNAV